MRVRGLAPWQPRAATAALVEQVGAILEEYHAHLPLTIRQIFYRLVGAGYPKDEHAYERLCETLNRARRSGRIPFEAIRDDGAVESAPFAFSGLPELWAAYRAAAEGYRRNRLEGQPRVVEVWAEAAGMVPQLEGTSRKPEGTHVRQELAGEGGCDAAAANPEKTTPAGFAAGGRIRTEGRAMKPKPRRR